MIDTIFQINQRKKIYIINYCVAFFVSVRYNSSYEAKNVAQHTVKVRRLSAARLHKTVFGLRLVVFCSATFLRLLERFAFLHRNRKNVIYSRNVKCHAKIDMLNNISKIYEIKKLESCGFAAVGNILFTGYLLDGHKK